MWNLTETILFLPFLLFLGLWSSYYDIKFYQVKNKLIIFGIAWGVIAYAGMNVLGVLDMLSIKRILINSFFAIILGFLIWKTKFWAAGDAKLFVVYSFLIPLSYYGNERMVFFFPSFIFLVNIFSIIFLFIMLEVAVSIFKSIFAFFKRPGKLKNKLFYNLQMLRGVLYKNKIAVFKDLLGYACIFLIFIFLKLFLERFFQFSPLFMYFFYLFLFFSAGFFSKLLKTNSKFLYVLSVFMLLCLGFYFLRFSGDALYSFTNTFSFLVNSMGWFLILSSLVYRYLEKKETRLISLEELQPKMQLTEKFIASYKLSEEGSFYPDGLTRNQVTRIKNILEQNHYSDLKVEVYRFIPMAPFVFFGVIVTIITRCSLPKFLGLY